MKQKHMFFSLVAIGLTIMLAMSNCKTEKKTEEKQKNHSDYILISNPGELVDKQFVDNKSTDL